MKSKIKHAALILGALTWPATMVRWMYVSYTQGVWGEDVFKWQNINILIVVPWAACIVTLLTERDKKPKLKRNQNQ